MTFLAWPEIEGFHHIRKHVRAYPDLLKGNNVVTYKAKVKLHGTNAAVHMYPSYAVGEHPNNISKSQLAFQSRSNMITPENDNAGFARWASEAFKERVKTYGGGPIVLFGEWCGPGIQKGVALSQLEKRCFAVFAARHIPPTYHPDFLITDPVELASLIEGVPDAHVLPWYKNSIEVTVDWSKSDEEVATAIAPINDWVMEVEANDPWVETVFGVKGTGEGLVFYPGGEHMKYESFQNLCFKAKGEKHKNIKTAVPVQVNAETAASIEAFVDLVLTEARLEQGARAVAGEHVHQDALSCLFCTTGKINFDMKQTGKFVAWCLADVQKETKDEMEASNLTWKDLQKPLSDKARAWYLTEAKK